MNVKLDKFGNFPLCLQFLLNEFITIEIDLCISYTFILTNEDSMNIGKIADGIID